MRFSFIYHSRQGEVFALDALDDRLGDEVTFRKDLGGSYSGTLVAAEVIRDGQALQITLEVPDEALSDVQDVIKGYSMERIGDPTKIHPHAYRWTGRSPNTCAVTSPDGSSEWCGKGKEHPIHQL